MRVAILKTPSGEYPVNLTDNPYRHLTRAIDEALLMDRVTPADLLLTIELRDVNWILMDAPEHERYLRHDHMLSALLGVPVEIAGVPSVTPSPSDSH